MTFKNSAPEEPEWSSHIRLLNEWQNPERLLRDIVQYARSGPFYPADMHVDLIEQVFANRTAVKFCAYGEEGIEHVADTPEELSTWIADMVLDNDVPYGYYSITTATQAELDAMPET